MTGAVNDNTTVAVPFADTEVADGAAAENVRDPNETANDEIVDAAPFVIVTVTVPVAPTETCPNATDVTGLPPTDSATGAGTVADSGTFSVNETPLTVPAMTSVSAYGAGAPGAVKESARLGVSVVARLDGGDVVVILNGEAAPDPIANVRPLIAAPATFDSVTVTGLVVPTGVFPNDTDVAGALPTVSPTGAVTDPETGMASVNGAPFHVPSTSSVSVYVWIAPGPANDSVSVPVPPLDRLVGAEEVVIVNGEEEPSANENDRPLSVTPAASDKVTVSWVVVPTGVLPNVTDDTDELLTESPTGPGVADTVAFCVKAWPPTVPVITSVSLQVCCTFGARNDSVSVAVPPGAIDVGPDTVNGDDEPEANENASPLIAEEPEFVSVTETEPVAPITTLPTLSVVTGEPPIAKPIGPACWKIGTSELDAYAGTADSCAVLVIVRVCPADSHSYIRFDGSVDSP